MAQTGTKIVASKSQQGASKSQQGLNAQQEAFVVARLSGSLTEQALAEAGYGPNDFLRVISDPAICSALDAGVKYMATNDAVDAIILLKTAARSGTSADRVRVDAARATLGIAGHVAPMRERGRHKTASLADMPADDLRALVDQIQGELGTRAVPVNGPKQASASPKRADFLA